MASRTTGSGRIVYDVAGGTNDNSWSTAPVEFRLDTIERIKPGLVSSKPTTATTSR
ncbi:hypothetical protein F4554_005443 [Actinopolymorpha rutila]|uniref:Uncharacterized protein n=1 Tax=Actinopolymorpha rutila TaxID=446787 RepID=A0A852ZL05_9ACTN|nr:hypothetical protein [Actinopolymorpha rutila]